MIDKRTTLLARRRWSTDKMVAVTTQQIREGNYARHEFMMHPGVTDIWGLCLNGANLRNCIFKFVKLISWTLDDADLSECSMVDASFRHCHFSRADLTNADLTNADLGNAVFREANLAGAVLHGADLSGAVLHGADLSGAKGLLSASEFMAKFEKDDLGYLVYRKFASDSNPTSYAPPKRWVVAEGSFVEEYANSIRTQSCGCGVNFGTAEWVLSNYGGAPIWLCRIRWEDLPGVVVPYNTDGKARCSCLELVRKINGENLQEAVWDEIRRRQESGRCANPS